MFNKEFFLLAFTILTSTLHVAQALDKHIEEESNKKREIAAKYNTPMPPVLDKKEAKGLVLWAPFDDLFPIFTHLPLPMNRPSKMRNF